MMESKASTLFLQGYGAGARAVAEKVREFRFTGPVPGNQDQAMELVSESVLAEVLGGEG